MAKSLCKSKKSRNDSMKRAAGIVCDASHVCRKCDRVASAQKKLCKPTKLTAID